MGSLLLSIVGVDESTLESCPPSERRRLTALGAIVVAIACVSAASGTFLAHEFLHTPLIEAMLLGACWGGIVLTLDRWMILSIRRQHSLTATLSLALTRVLLAFALGLATAPPVLLRIFAPETIAVGTQEKQAALLAGEQALARRFTSITTLEVKSASLEKQIGSQSSGASLAGDPAYAQAVQKATQLRSEANAATERALCEADGTCGTRTAGEGPDYRLKQQVAQQLTSEARAAEGQAEQLRATLLHEESASAGERRSRTRSELTSVEAMLREQRRARSLREAELQRAYDQPLGLAERLDALSNLAASHPSVAWWNWIVAIIIILLDTSPALGKLVMVLGDPTPYEFQIEQDEHLHRDVSRIYREAEREKAEIEARSDVEYAEQVRELRPEHFKKVALQQVKAEAAERRRWLKAKLAHMRMRMDEQIRREFGEPAPSGNRSSGASRNGRGQHRRGFGRRRPGHDA